MTRGEEGPGTEIPVELAATAEVLEQLGARLESSDAAEAMVYGIEVGGPIAAPRPDQLKFGEFRCALSDLSDQKFWCSPLAHGKLFRQVTIGSTPPATRNVDEGP